MVIDPTLRGICAQFGVDPQLIAAVQQAEGGPDALIRAVQCSLPSVQTREKALDVACRSAVHAMDDFLRERGLRADFVAFWAARWAPDGAANDPTHINAHWSANVTQLWTA
jgi:hypothetical protein